MCQTPLTWASTSMSANTMNITGNNLAGILVGVGLIGAASAVFATLGLTVWKDWPDEDVKVDSTPSNTDLPPLVAATEGSPECTSCLQTSGGTDLFASADQQALLVADYFAEKATILGNGALAGLALEGTVDASGVVIMSDGTEFLIEHLDPTTGPVVVNKGGGTNAEVANLEFTWIDSITRVIGDDEGAEITVSACKGVGSVPPAI